MVPPVLSLSPLCLSRIPQVPRHWRDPLRLFFFFFFLSSISVPQQGEKYLSQNTASAENTQGEKEMDGFSQKIHASKVLTFNLHYSFHILISEISTTNELFCLQLATTFHWKLFSGLWDILLPTNHNLHAKKSTCNTSTLYTFARGSKHFIFSSKWQRSPISILNNTFLSCHSNLHYIRRSNLCQHQDTKRFCFLKNPKLF